MRLQADDSFQHLLDHPIPLRCPLCGVQSGMVPVSIPRHSLVVRFQLAEVGCVYRCSSCSGPVFLKFKVAEIARTHVLLDDTFEQISLALEPFEMQYLSGAVAEDFTEALKCYAS